MLAVAVYDIFSSRIPEFRGEISASAALLVTGLLVLGRPLGVVSGAVGTLVSELYLRAPFGRGRSLAKVQVLTFNLAQIALTLGVTAWVLGFADVPIGGLRGIGDFGLASGMFALFVLLNSSLVSGVVSLSTGQPFRYLTADWFRDFALQYLILGLSTLLLVVLYSISPWHMLLGLTPLVLVHFSFRSFLRIRAEAQRTFEKVVTLLEQRDPYTGAHSQEVGELAVEVARELGLRASQAEMIKSVARVHDIGKIAVPDSILLKPGKLEPHEWEIMKRHTEVGADLLKGLEIYGRYADVVRYEHEHWDGTGYPEGLRGEAIPLAARVIAAADVYHALTSDRPYRPAYSDEEAQEIIRKMAGRELDPKVLGALLRVLERRQQQREQTEGEAGQ
ncbi:MAG: HD-GYP domain-containing protein [Candidatus Bipolaricaulaceae bacterium]